MTHYKMGEEDGLMKNGYIILSDHHDELAIAYTDVISNKKHKIYLVDEQIKQLYEILKERFEISSVSK